MSLGKYIRTHTDTACSIYFFMHMEEKQLEKT